MDRSASDIFQVPGTETPEIDDLRNLSPLYFEVAINYGASPSQVFRQVILPGSSPMILAGIRLALNLSLSITTSVELVMGRNGLGAMIWNS